MIQIEYIADSGTPGEVPNWLALNIDISGDIGRALALSSMCHQDTVVEAHQVAALIVGGSVFQDITLISDSLKSDGVFTGVDIAGDFLGDLDVPGNIGQFLVEGDIGTSSRPACIETGADLVTIQAENIYADITVADNLELLRVFGSGDAMTAATDGVFEGSLNSDTMTNFGMLIYGDLDANVDIATSTNGVNGRIAVGKDLNGDITIGSGGLGVAGITIGWMPSVTNPQWVGDIEIDGEDLMPKGEYTQTPAGSGAVGVAPYGLHREACNPAYNPGYPVVSPSPSQSIELVHYGAIQLAPSTGIPYTVYEASGPHCDGTCIHGLLTDVTGGDPGPPVRDPWTLVGGIAGRTVTIKGPTFAGKHYHIVLNVGSGSVQHLETADLFGTQRDIPSYLYVIGTQ